MKEILFLTEGLFVLTVPPLVFHFLIVGPLLERVNPRFLLADGIKAKRDT